MWVIFDLNGTLLDPAGLLDPPEIPIAALDEANMMAMVTVLAGRETTFKPLFEAALRRGLERAGREPVEVDLSTLPPYPDVPDALQSLRDAGFRLAVLTQSAVEPSETALANAGIREHFEHVLSAPESGAFKPEDLAYRAALETARRDRRLVRRRPLVGRRGRDLRGPQDGLDQPHRPRLPGRHARAPPPRHRRRGRGRKDKEGQSLFRFGGIGGGPAGGGSSPARARS